LKLNLDIEEIAIGIRFFVERWIMTDEDKFALEDPEKILELMFIDEYLKNRGFPLLRELCHLSETEIKLIMIEACKYASSKLAEVDSKDKFLRSIHRPS
jgi:hypothetical protein